MVCTKGLANYLDEVTVFSGVFRYQRSSILFAGVRDRRSTKVRGLRKYWLRDTTGVLSFVARNRRISNFSGSQASKTGQDGRAFPADLDFAGYIWPPSENSYEECLVEIRCSVQMHRALFSILRSLMRRIIKTIKTLKDISRDGYGVASILRLMLNYLHISPRGFAIPHLWKILHYIL